MRARSQHLAMVGGCRSQRRHHEGLRVASQGILGENRAEHERETKTLMSESMNNMCSGMFREQTEGRQHLGAKKAGANRGGNTCQTFALYGNRRARRGTTRPRPIFSIF